MLCFTVEMMGQNIALYIRDLDGHFEDQNGKENFIWNLVCRSNYLFNVVHFFGALSFKD